MDAPTLVTYKGRPVPYVSAWSSERVDLPQLRATAGGLVVEGQLCDAAGVSWKPWGNALGVGEPDYGAVHLPRQRECMHSLLCQVCRRPVQRDGLGWPWLLEDHRSEPGWPEREVTTHPPVCEACQPVSAIQCDPNRGSFVSVRVGRVLVDGVYGQLYTPAPHPAPAGGETVLFAGDPRLLWMLGGQVAATLLDVTIVDMSQLGTHAPAPREVVRR
ncbi:hypothetical protein JCM4814A_78750 [Streptomyces phaeofaciens JCM 4814]|uniref:Uncharacterized protein n=1 Tax=Streptomyces phaeofaciens TaxID=68254 RepID=A0A918HS67_9ACTN|nr:hypothetical protein [Streptomyces phaeofaciens]GGT96093.1 hypothetical protein GCM10010226_87120 [Streptomyces phaeofaciens]